MVVQTINEENTQSIAIKMKIKEIELANISRYRGELMGAAMIFVILFHVGLPRDDTFFGLRRIGNIGVDIFLSLAEWDCGSHGLRGLLLAISSPDASFESIQHGLS